MYYDWIITNTLNMKEIKQIIGFEEYLITTNGEVINKNNKILKPQNNGKGYLFIRLRNKSKFYIHRLVAINFIPNPNNLPQVNHIDGNKVNNTLSNLEWCNNSLNQIHARKLGLNKGRKYLRKLNKEDINEIYNAYVNKGITRKELAEKFKVSKQMISDIKTKNKKLHKKYCLIQLVDFQ